MLKVKILLIPAIKMALEQRESFWHANGHRKREKHAKIDLRLAGYGNIWMETRANNLLCQAYFDSMGKKLLSTHTIFVSAIKNFLQPL